MGEISEEFYQIKPLQLGAEISGIDLNEPVSEHVIEKIRQDVYKYRLLIFKQQGVLSTDRQVEITQWFGQVSVTLPSSRLILNVNRAMRNIVRA